LAGAFEPIFTMTETRAACRSGVTHAALGPRGGAPARRLRPRAGSAGRSRVRNPMRPARRSCGPIDPWSSVIWFECWWPAARGNPASVGRVSQELTKRPAPQVPCEWRLRVVPEGRKCPAVTRRTCPVTPRHAGGVSPIRPRGFIRRATVSVASGMNDQEGASPSDGVWLPTRSKPSKGVALVGMWTASESPSGGDDGSPETQRTPCPVPGCNRPGSYVAEETVEVV
jgi:hypothetical protein